MSMDYDINIIIERTIEIFEKEIKEESFFIKKIKKFILKLVGVNRISKDIYNWKNCLLALSLIEGYKVTKNDKIIKIVEKYVDNFNENYMIKEIDSAVMGELLIELKKINNTNKYDKKINQIYFYIKEAPIDKEGSKLYRKQMKNYIFADTIGLVCPFLFKNAKIFNNLESEKLGILQIDNFIKNAQDNESNLFYHGYNLETNECCGIVGWGRAEGWVLRGIVEGLEFINDDKKIEYSRFLEKHFKIINNHIVNDKYLPWALTCKKGHIDTSSMTMIFYAFYKYNNINITSFRKFIDGIVEYDVSGKLVSCSAECNGFSQYPQMYGNYSYGQAFYLLIISLCYDLKKE